MKEKKQIKWRIELTEHQLRLISNCVEDCHRFIGGQMELSNSTVCLERYFELKDELEKLKPLVTPMLGRGASYGWNGEAAQTKTSASFSLKRITCIVRYATKLLLTRQNMKIWGGTYISERH